MKSPSLNASAATADDDAARARRKQAAVHALIRKTGRDGRNALGLIRDSPLAREAFDLGEEYRRSQTAP
jgi:hypothetical protein